MLENFPEFNACQEKFEGTQYQFFQKFQGYEDEITLCFTQGFYGKVIQIGNFLMTVSEKTIARATGLPCCGERWFKNRPIERVDCARFMKEEYQSEN